MNYATMLVKELKELARSFRLLFVPVLFAILAVGQPVAVKMMPRLMASATNLPKGTVIQIPTPPPAEVVAGIIGQLNQIGILALVLVCMATIAGERLSGVAATVLTKPVGRGEYLAAKATAYGLLAAFSLAAGLGLGAYYTQLLIGPVNWGWVGQALLLYLPNLLLVVAVTICFSAFMPSPLAAGGASLGTIFALNVAPRYLGHFAASVYPGALTESSARLLATGSAEPMRPLLGVLALALTALLAGWLALRRQEI